MKIFIINLIYRAFPKVEIGSRTTHAVFCMLSVVLKVACRYGSISRLYKGLPTDQQLQDYYELSDKDRVSF